MGRSGTAQVQPPATASNALQGVHDPCIAKEKAFYYIYSTGRGIPIRRSADLIHWQQIGRVFPDDPPAWIAQSVPSSRGFWAPDISYFGGLYHLYYAVSTFGTNRSAIGLATNPTLDPAAKNYHWTDQGKVLESTPMDNYNAIDPNLVSIGNNQYALDFGSFWSGIKLIPLDAATGKPTAGAKVVAIAQRPPPDALEAPFIIRHGTYFYLFESWDYCCRGTDSTYNIRVGRATQAAGPYADRLGQSLLSGGGTLLLGTQGTVIGPGHCAVLQDPKGDLLIHHFYDGAQHGIATLQIHPLTWADNGWPVVGPPLKISG